VRRSAELGYWVHPDVRGHGVATEATRLALRHALLPEDEGGLGLVRVTARAAVGNDASLAVLRRIGMRHVGTVHLASPTRAGLADAELLEMVDRQWSSPLASDTEPFWVGIVRVLRLLAGNAPKSPRCPPGTSRLVRTRGDDVPRSMLGDVDHRSALGGAAGG
jgi:hypothetical protein